MSKSKVPSPYLRSWLRRSSNGAKGFSLMEVMIAIVILSVVTAGVITILDLMALGQRTQKYGNNTLNLIEEIRSALGSPQGCVNSFGGFDVTATPHQTPPTIYVPAKGQQIFDNAIKPNLIYQIGSEDIDKTVQIQTMRFTNFTPIPGKAGFGQLTLRIDYMSLQQTQAPYRFGDILLQAQVNSANQIISCVSVAKMSDSIWQIVPNTAYNIFFNGVTSTRVGIGTPSPVSTFEVVGDSIFRDPISNSVLRFSPAPVWPEGILTLHLPSTFGQIGFAHTNGNVYIGTAIVPSPIIAGMPCAAPCPPIGQIGTVSSHGFQLYTNNTPRETIWANGTTYFSQPMGIAAAPSGPSSSDKLRVGGNVIVQGDVTAYGTVSGSGTVTTSDARLKRDITGLSDPLQKILQLRGVNYYWKDPKRGESKQMGVIAQEIEKVYPEAVTTGTDGFKGVLYNMLIGPLIDSVKSLNAMIGQTDHKLRDLEQKVSRMAAENAELKARLERLEKK